MATSTRRDAIVNVLVELFKTIDGTSPFVSNLYDNVKPKLVFWDEVSEYPFVSIVAGGERREYLPGGFKWGLLDIKIRIYAKDEEAKTRLEEIFEDVEILLDANNNLQFGATSEEVCTDIRILSITDDEGLLNPIGVGEMILEVRYPILT